MQTTALQKKEQLKMFEKPSSMGQEEDVVEAEEVLHEPGVPLFLQRFAASASAPPIRPKLKVSQPDDPYEQEADRMADQAMGMPDKKDVGIISGKDRLTNQNHTPQNKAESPFNGEEAWKMGKKSNESELLLPHGYETFLSSMGGHPLPEHVRTRIEPVLGMDLSNVSVHADFHAQEAARAIHARAFTNRNHIYLGEGQSAGDVALMAHESAHVVQQGGAMGQPRVEASLAVSPAAVPSIQRSPLSDELEMVWETGDRDVFFERLRHLGVSDLDVHNFVEATLVGDDHWLAINLLSYGPELQWPIHLRVEREMKGWGDARGKGAVFDILRGANGTEVYNLDLQITIFSLFPMGTDDFFLADNLLNHGAETNWPIPLQLELKLRQGDKPGFFTMISNLAGSMAGDATIRSALSRFVIDARISWVEAFQAAALLELGPRRDWPQLIKNYDEGLSTGVFTLSALPPVTAEGLRQFCMVRAGEAAEGTAIMATYRTRFNALWDAPANAALPSDFDPTLDSKGPRNARARAVFTVLYADPAVKSSYDTNTPTGFREMCNTLMGPEGTNLIASPRLQTLRALLNPPAVIATGTTDAPFVALTGTIRPVARLLDGADRQQLQQSPSWRLLVDAKISGGTAAVTHALREELWNVVTTSQPLAAASTTAPSAPAPVAETLPTLTVAQRTFLGGITLTAPVSPVRAATAEQALTFQARSVSGNPGLAARRHVTVEPAGKVIRGQDDETPWPAGSRSVPHTVTVDPDAGGAASQVFTARLNMPPLVAADFSEKTAIVTLEDQRKDWFVNNIAMGATYMNENTRTTLGSGTSVNYFGGQLCLTVCPELPAENPGLQIFMEGAVRKSGTSVHTFARKPFGRTAVSDQLGSYIEREGSAPPASEPMEIEVSFFTATGPSAKTLTLPFTVNQGLPVASGTDAAVLAADNTALNLPATTTGSLLHYMTTNFPPTSNENRVANGVATGAIQVAAVIVRSDSAAWLAANSGNPATQVAYACGNMTNSHVLVNAPGAAGWQWGRFPNVVFLNLTPQINNPSVKRSNAEMASLLAHEGIHAADIREPGDIGRYATEFRAYWVMGVGAGQSTAPDPTMTGRGPKSERSRAIFEHLYNSPLYSSYVRPNYDDNVNHFREQVDSMLVPDGINLILSGNLQALRAEIESYTGVAAAFAVKRSAIQARYVACTPADRTEITGNRTWRNLVESKFTISADQATIKTDLGIPR